MPDSLISEDRTRPGAGDVVTPQSPITARRKALKAMLGAAPVVLTFPAVTAAAASVSCQTALNQAATRPAAIATSNDPTWLRVLVTRQIYNGNKILYKYPTGTTTWYYDPKSNYARTLSPPPGYTHLESESTVYVLADISTNPVAPDFTGAGTNSTLSCMSSIAAA
jgi:hypothetical protein